jgi:hypothetical protein
MAAALATRVTMGQRVIAVDGFAVSGCGISGPEVLSPRQASNAKHQDRDWQGGGLVAPRPHGARAGAVAARSAGCLGGVLDQVSDDPWVTDHHDVGRGRDFDDLAGVRTAVHEPLGLGRDRRLTKAGPAWSSPAVTRAGYEMASVEARPVAAALLAAADEVEQS